MSTNPEYSIREIRTPFAVMADRRATAARRAMASVCIALATAMQRARRRARLRRELEWLDARQLRDIGRTRAELELEAAKPFWRR